MLVLLFSYHGYVLIVLLRTRDPQVGLWRQLHGRSRLRGAHKKWLWGRSRLWYARCDSPKSPFPVGSAAGVRYDVVWSLRSRRLPNALAGGGCGWGGLRALDLEVARGWVWL